MNLVQVRAACFRGFYRIKFSQTRANPGHYRTHFGSHKSFSKINNSVVTLTQLFSTTNRRLIDPLSDGISTNKSSVSALSRDINGCTSHLDVLEKLNNHNISELKALDIHFIVERLLDTFYGSLNYIPWLQSNVDIAYIQLLLANKVTPLTQDLWNHSSMREIIARIDTVSDEMTPLQLAQTFHRLLYLGISSENENQEKLLARLCCLSQDKIPESNLEELSIFTGIHGRMFMHDNMSIKLELDRLEELLRDPTLELSPESTVHLGNLLRNVISMPAADQHKHIVPCAVKLLSRVEGGGCLEIPDNISMFLRLARKLFMHSHGEQISARRLITLASEACIEKLHLFDCHNIAEACAALRQSRCYTKELTTAFANRSVELMHDGLKLSDISNLFYAIGRSSSFEVKRLFENALFQRLHEVDIILLSNLTENFVSVNLNNEDLIHMMHQHIADHADSLVAYNTRFIKVVRLLLRKPFVDPEKEHKFTQAVLDKFEKQMKLSNLAIYCVYLLPTVHTNLPEDVYQRLLQAIPKMKSFDHHRMALALNQIRNPTALYRKQIASMQSVLHEWIMVKSEEIKTLDYLFQLSLEMVVNTRRKDPVLTTHFLEMYPRFTKNLTDVGMLKVLNVFSELSYYMPEVYDDVTSFALDEDVAREKVLFLLMCLSRVGYCPKRFDEFTSMILHMFDELEKNGLLREVLLIIRNLNILNVYPEDKLSHMFSIEFIEKLDNFIAENPKSKQEIESLMMVLNRNAILECPQLDIPWFHEEFVANNTKPESDRISFALKFKDEVENVLLDPELLDKEENLRRWTQSPYGYIINFECVLDDEKNPVPLEDYDDKALPHNMQRVALLTLTERSYTYNQRRLLGMELLRRRHLEILGYKVVEIPYFEWYSMGLSDYMAKVEYLSSKVFDS